MVDIGFCVFPFDPAVAAWAQAAQRTACRVSTDPTVRHANMRHGNTWFVGVDALPNAADGSIDGVPLGGAWQKHVDLPAKWHPAQISIVYPGYPQRDPIESEANHSFRIKRFAAHVDGLLPEGPKRRRFLREPHAFILGLPLNVSTSAPLMVWPGSQVIMGAAFGELAGAPDLMQVDLTEVYQAARRRVFEQIEPEPIVAQPGQAVLLHRHLLHGVAPWGKGGTASQEGRMIAYFRPQFSVLEWLECC